MPEILGFYKTITVDEIIEESKIQTVQDTVKVRTDAKLEKLRQRASGYKES